MKQEKINKILQIIKNDKAQENHLFKILATTENPFSLLKPLKNAGYFNPKKNSSPIEVENQKGYFTIPHWNVLDYLENTARHNKKVPSEDITNTLLKILNSIIAFKKENKERIDNYRTDWVLTKIIFLLPLEKIESKHFEFLHTALNSMWDTTLISSEIGKSIIPVLLKEKSKKLLIKLFEIILDYKVIENNISDKYVSVIDKYWLKEALKKHKLKIAKLCGIKIAIIGINKIKSILKEDKSQFNIIWIPTIEDHPQITFPDRYECQLVHFVRDMFELSELQKIKEEIKNLLKEEHPIFKRIAIHIINYHYKDLNELFWSWQGNPLEENQLKHELYELFKNNCSYFSKEQINKVLQWIESKKYYTPEERKDDKDQVKKIQAYRKKEWLSALLDTRASDVLSSYKKYDQTNPAVLEHPGFSIWSERGWGSVSPIEEVDLLSKSINKIVNYLNNFKEKGGWKSLTVDGLSGILKKSVSKNTDKFTDSISSFLGVKRVYQYSLLVGFSDAWRSKKHIEWKSIFKFINEILKSEDFWKENYPEEGYHYRNWIISQVAELINEGTKNDQYAFDPVYLPEAEKILLLLVDRAESNFYKIHDIVTSVLNSVKGKIFTAMINYSLRYARLYKRKNEKKWVNSIKEDFTKRLNREIEPSLEFSVILGEYLANLYWLDKKWVVDNLEKIFLKKDEIVWKAAFTGYLFYSSTVYSDLYKPLSKKSHYSKALKIDFEDDHLIDRIAQHICVAYLEGWEKFEDKESLINKLLASSNTKHLSAIISFFWMQRDNITKKIKDKIKPLWEKLYIRLEKNKDDEEYHKLISDTSKWLILVDQIDDDIYKWLNLSVKQIETNFNAPFFIEYLLKHVDKTPNNVANLYIEMLNKGFYPDFKKEHIVEIITKLNSNKLKEKAVNICNLYLNKGFEFTRPILEDIQNNKKTK